MPCCMLQGNTASCKSNYVCQIACCKEIQPARNPRFGSFRTQPLEILSADSVRISLKRNPTLGTNLG